MTRDERLIKILEKLYIDSVQDKVAFDRATQKLGGMPAWSSSEIINQALSAIKKEYEVKSGLCIKCGYQEGNCKCKPDKKLLTDREYKQLIKDVCGMVKPSLCQCDHSHYAGITVKVVDGKHYCPKCGGEVRAYNGAIMNKISHGAEPKMSKEKLRR